MSDALLDIRTETKLLAEIKDIRDELNILNVVLESQMVALEGFEEIVLGEIRSSDSGSGSGNGSVSTARGVPTLGVVLAIVLAAASTVLSL